MNSGSVSNSMSLISTRRMGLDVCSRSSTTHCTPVSIRDRCITGEKEAVFFLASLASPALGTPLAPVTVHNPSSQL